MGVAAVMGGWRASYAMRRRGLLTVDVEIIEGRRPQAHRDAAHSRGPRALKDLDEEHLQPRFLCIGLAARQSGPLCGHISARSERFGQIGVPTPGPKLHESRGFGQACDSTQRVLQ